MFETLRTSIQRNIHENELRQITGEALQRTLLDIVDDVEQAVQTVPITYAELKTLRDAGKLVPAQYYRITDYVATTTQENTMSAGHQFDIIVFAIDAHTLSENARAALHEGDEYFASCKLSAWQIKYTIDNDAKRFVWADAENGKGIIYRMIDEWNNDCPYDFKNMMFKVYYDNAFGAYKVGAKVNSEWSYTFCMLDKYDNKAHDVSVEQYKYINDEGFYSHTYDNRMLSYYDDYANASGESNANNGAYKLNANVFVTNTDLCSISDSYGEFYAFCYNAFGNNCSNNAFGNNCGDNAFGEGCNNNTFGDSCHSNAFGNNCGDNAFGNNCGDNAFGNYSNRNAFGNSCNSNSFGNNCDGNSFGNSCSSNSFENDCHNNTFGNYCNYNAFGNNCSNNSFGDGCESNAFGNNCSNNALPNYCYYNKFDSAVQYATVQNTQTASITMLVQYYHVTLGVVGKSDAKKTIQTTRNNKVMTVVGVDASGNIQTITPFV